MVNRRTGQVKNITSLDGSPIAPALLSQVNKSIEPALESSTRLDTMEQNAEDALRGNQQAMLSLVANHIGMTLGAQKGARINQAVWNEAVGSAKWIQSKTAGWFHLANDGTGDMVFDGYKSGVNLTPDQINQMVDLARQRKKLVWKQAQQAGKMYGVNVPIPEDQPSVNGPKKKELDNLKGKGGAKAFVDNGTVYDIPPDKIAAFKAKHPNAKEQ
jgi:hypothetical protein